jgi:hypothetical protein
MSFPVSRYGWRIKMTNAHNVLLLQIARATFFIAVFTIFASLSTAQAASNLGGGSFGFSCDVNTQKCECKGVETGADCEGMKKNCGTNRVICWDNTTTGPMCVCNMAMKKRIPSNVAPTLKQIAPKQ